MLKTIRTTRAPLRTSALAAALLLVLGAVGCATTTTPGTQLDDAAIGTRIEARLAADPQVSATEIDVDVQNGFVRLSGNVENPEAVEQAQHLAIHTRGVRGVNNDLVVGDKTLGEELDDAAITAAVKTKLAADPEVSATNIDVDTEKGVVTLSGKVKSERARTEAEQLARDTEGVVDVRNLVEIVG